MTTKTKNDRIDRCGSTLDLIHTDICGPLTPIALGVISILLFLLMISLDMDM